MHASVEVNSSCAVFVVSSKNHLRITPGAVFYMLKCGRKSQSTIILDTGHGWRAPGTHHTSYIFDLGPSEVRARTARRPATARASELNVPAQMSGSAQRLRPATRPGSTCAAQAAFDTSSLRAAQRRHACEQSAGLPGPGNSSKGAVHGAKVDAGDSDQLPEGNRWPP